MSSRTGWIVVAVISAVFAASKWQVLGLPCYWDEAFPYSLAVRYQVDHGLSALPDAMPENLSTGHPPLFYFLMAAWMKVSGTGITAARIFPLLLSVLCLLALYRLGKKHFSVNAGVIAVALTASYGTFYVQSVFMLPEVLLALLILLALDEWLRKRWVPYIIYGALAVLTKEPAVMFILALCIWEVVRWRTDGNRRFIALLRNCLLAGTPGLLGGLYFLIQKLQKGWFFFPRHLKAASWDTERFLHQFFDGYASAITIYKGHLIFTLLMIAAVVVLVLRRKTEFPKKGIAALVILTFILFFTGFSAVNFYNSGRYILCVYPAWFLLTGWLTDAMLTQKWKWALIPTTLLLCGLHVFYLVSNHRPEDTSMGYADRVKVQQEGIQWLQQNGYGDRPVITTFLMGYNMHDPAPGYVSPGREFRLTGIDDAAAIIVVTDQEASVDETQGIRGKLVKRFEQGYGWMEVYERAALP